jgi:hypothetical protein
VPPGARFRTDIHGSHFQMCRLTGPKRLFHQGEILVPLMDHRCIGHCPWQIGLAYLAAVAPGGLLLSRPVYAQAQRAAFGLPWEPPMDFQALEHPLERPEGH